MKNIYYYIYKITSPKGKIYIGRTNNIKRRMRVYKSTKKIKDQKLIEASILKYGFENHVFEVIEEGQGTPDFISNREIYYMDLYNSLRKNNQDGLNLVRGSKGGDYCKKYKVSQKQLQASKKNLLKAIEFNKTKRVYTPISSKQKEQISIKNSGSNSKVSKLVLNTETGIYYESIRQCAKYHNIAESTLRSHLLNYVKSSSKPFIYA